MKRQMVGIALAALVLMGNSTVLAAEKESSVSPKAECTSWVFHQTGTSCTNPLCGPGAILHTKYLKGYRDRYCNSTGYEKQPYTKVKPGCC